MTDVPSESDLYPCNEVLISSEARAFKSMMFLPLEEWQPEQEATKAELAVSFLVALVEVRSSPPEPDPVQAEIHNIAVRKSAVFGSKLRLLSDPDL